MIDQQTRLETANVVRHLMWHKAMASHSSDMERITDYIGLVVGDQEGEHVSMQDDFHRDLAIAMELVTQNHMDPWDLDLSKFSQLYLREARERGVDLVTAGRIILMAWTVLKLQSDEVVVRAQSMQQEEESFDWDDLPDWDMSDEEWDYTERIQQLPQAPIDEKIRHKSDRKVTLMELIHAFEEVHEEADERIKLQEVKRKARLSLKRKMRGKVGNMMHKEDQEAEIAETWQRILEHPSHPIPFGELVEAEALDRVQNFTSLLFLCKSGRITVTQENFPYGEIWITPILPEMKEMIELEVTA